MIRAVVRSLFVVCVLAGVGFAETPAAAPAQATKTTTSHVAKKHAHKKTKRKARKAKHRHHKAKKHAPATQTK